MRLGEGGIRPDKNLERDSTQQVFEYTKTEEAQLMPTEDVTSVHQGLKAAREVLAAIDHNPVQKVALDGPAQELPIASKKRPSLIERTQAYLKERKRDNSVRRLLAESQVGVTLDANLSSVIHEGKLGTLEEVGAFSVSTIVRRENGSRLLKISSFDDSESVFITDDDLGSAGPYMTISVGDTLFFSKKNSEEILDGDTTVSGNFDVIHNSGSVSDQI